MNRQRIVRAATGCGGLIACLALLSGHARAALPTQTLDEKLAARRVAGPNMSGTVTLPVTAAKYLDSWERARRTATGNPRLSLLIAPARTLSRADQAIYVQAAVHRRIRWISDATEWGRHDYWASAAETLARGAGDMEDRAILKMEALKNLGMPARDLYLTMGRDRVAGPITVLIARIDGRYLMFDDSDVAPKPVEMRPDFEPILTLGHGGSWLHGKRVAPERLAVKAVTPQGSAPLSTGSQR